MILTHVSYDNAYETINFRHTIICLANMSNTGTASVQKYYKYRILTAIERAPCHLSNSGRQPIKSEESDSDLLLIIGFVMMGLSKFLSAFRHAFSEEVRKDQRETISEYLYLLRTIINTGLASRFIID